MFSYFLIWCMVSVTLFYEICIRCQAFEYIIDPLLRHLLLYFYSLTIVELCQTFLLTDIFLFIYKKKYNNKLQYTEI